MKRVSLLIVIFVLLSSIAYADEIIIKSYPIKHKYWVYDGLFVPPNIIVINGYENSYQYKQTLVWEYAHYLCYTLYGDWFCNNPDNEIWNKDKIKI